MTALEQYNTFTEGETIDDPIERLRFFLSLALIGQDWLDVEQFIDDVSQQFASRDAEVATLNLQLNEQTDSVGIARYNNDISESFSAGAASRDAEIAELVAALERIRDEPAESDTCNGIEPHVVAAKALAKVRKP